MTNVDTDYRIVVFSSGCVSLPLITYLHGSKQLAGVVVSDRAETDTNQLLLNLKHMNVATKKYIADNDESMAIFFQQVKANIGFVFSFPHRISSSIINQLGVALFNLHASALPLYRGKSPIFWQIKNRVKSSAICLIALHGEDEQLWDSGPIVWQQPLPINERDTLMSLTTEVALLAPQLVQQFLQQLAAGRIEAKPQQSLSLLNTQVTAPAPSAADLAVDWLSMTASEICALARAANPSLGGAGLRWRNTAIGLLQGTVVCHESYGVQPSTVLCVGEPEGLIVTTIDGAIRIDVVNLSEGVFSGLAFAERFGLGAGMAFCESL
ncbi:formyltransferase family protein [uncultured Ferrimonas sp.]|uniref:methionyl-tRNA formyltransferase n=1 Tax=uncultured Ferrimonas sp. TaxID=432640 RepID=UPI00262A28F3|nr:formyltransferase family protein [uncultured Ferrimonas sp.]